MEPTNKIAKKYPDDWQLVEDEFVLPERWCVKDCEEVSIYAAEVHDCGQGHSYNRYYCRYRDRNPNNNNSYRFIHKRDSHSYVEITFEQFKQYVLQEDVMDKELIGYNLKDDCKKYDEAAKAIASGFSTKKIANVEFGSKSYTAEKLQAAGVLDLWFEPVYEAKYSLPKINGYKGEADGFNTVKYGCAEFKVSSLKAILNVSKELGNRSISEIVFSSGVKVGINDIKQIVEYFDNL